MHFRRVDEIGFCNRANTSAAWKILACGAAAGLANGFFGAGGGLILIPLLIGWIRLPEKTAFATSLAIMVPLSMTSLVVYILRSGLDAGFAWRYLAGGAIGGVLAGWMFRRLPVELLRRVMGVFLIYGGIRAVLLL